MATLRKSGLVVPAQPTKAKARILPQPKAPQPAPPQHSGGLLGFLGHVANTVAHPAEHAAQDVSSHAAHLAHWIVYGTHPGGGLTAVPGQAAKMFDPRTVSGAANLAGTLFGGSDMLPEEPATAGMNTRMPGQFSDYSLPKAQASGQIKFGEGQPYDVRGNAAAAKTAATLHNTMAQLQALQMLHDTIFGGTVHATGHVPPRPGP